MMCADEEKTIIVEGDEYFKIVGGSSVKIQILKVVVDS